MSETVHFLGDV